MVEDDAPLSRDLSEFFELMAGWEVVRAISASDAMSVLKERGDGFDVILLDIMMPPDEVVDDERSRYGQDTGILLLEKIRGATRSRIPVVVLTARQGLEWMQSSGKVELYLRKTILRPEEIIEGVRDTVERVQLERRDARE